MLQKAYRLTLPHVYKSKDVCEVYSANFQTVSNAGVSINLLALSAIKNIERMCRMSNSINVKSFYEFCAERNLDMYFLNQEEFEHQYAIYEEMEE